jgi:hypothetical protein
LWQQVIRYIRERRRSLRRKLPASALKKIPTKKWTKQDPYETCAICLDDFVEQEKIRVLPCSHAYHMKCIDPWLTKGKNHKSMVYLCNVMNYDLFFIKAVEFVQYAKEK